MSTATTHSGEGIDLGDSGTRLGGARTRDAGLVEGAEGATEEIDPVALIAADGNDRGGGRVAAVMRVARRRRSVRGGGGGAPPAHVARDDRRRALDAPSAPRAAARRRERRGRATQLSSARCHVARAGRSDESRVVSDDWRMMNRLLFQHRVFSSTTIDAPLRRQHAPHAPPAPFATVMKQFTGEHTPGSARTDTDPTVPGSNPTSPTPTSSFVP